MQSCLIDTSTLLDLALHFPFHSRNQPDFGSSIWDAIEALIIYDAILVDGPTFNGFMDGSRTLKHFNYPLYFHEKEEDELRYRLADMKAFCTPIIVYPDEEAQIYAKIVTFLNKHLKSRKDVQAPPSFPGPHLQYGLAIESGLGYTWGSWELSDVVKYVPQEIVDSMSNIITIFEQKKYPMWASWGLFLIRLCYYTVLQKSYGTHFIPHRDKAVVMPNLSNTPPLAKDVLNFFRSRSAIVI